MRAPSESRRDNLDTMTDNETAQSEVAPIDARQALSVRAPDHRSARSRRADAQLGVGGIDEWAWRSPADERRQRARVARGARVGAAARRGAAPAETAAHAARRAGACAAGLARDLLPRAEGRARPALARARRRRRSRAAHLASRRSAQSSLRRAAR